MTQSIDFEGATHEFPDDFTQQDIAKALSTHEASAPPPMTWNDLPKHSIPEGVAGLMDSMGNLPTEAINLAKLPYGTAAQAIGNATGWKPPDWLTGTVDNPNFARRLAQTMGIIDEQPRAMTPGMRAADMGMQFATGAALGPGGEVGQLPRATTALRQVAAEIPYAARELTKRFLPPAVAGATTSAVGQATGSPNAALITAMAFPAAAGKAGEVMKAAQANEALNAPRAAIAARGRTLGLFAAPDSTNPTWYNKLATWAGDPIEVDANLANKNNAQVKNLAAQDVGLSARTLSPQALADVRRQQGNVNTFIKASPDFQTRLSRPAVDSNGQPIPNTNAFQQGVRELTDGTGPMTALFPHASVKDQRVVALQKDLRNLSTHYAHGFNAEAAVNVVSRWRAKSADLWRGDAGDKEVARAYDKASSLMDNLIDDNLQARGQTGLLDKLRASREVMAKTYAIQDALDSANRVDANKLAAIHAERPGYLTGNLKDIAEFASQFPRNVELNHVRTSALSIPARMSAYAMLGGGGAHLAGADNLTTALTIAGLATISPASRAVMTSNIGQRLGVPDFSSPVAEALSNVQQNTIPLALAPELLKGQ